MKVERKTKSIPEAAVILGIGRNKCYELVREGVIRAIDLGNRKVIPDSEIERILAGEAQSSDAA